MKATFYEALGIDPTASDDEIRAAMRHVIRRYYAKARDGRGNIEEALRFINYASRILGNPELRRRYDEELRASAGSGQDPDIDDMISAVEGRSARASRSEPPRIDRSTAAGLASGDRDSRAGTEASVATRPGRTSAARRTRSSQPGASEMPHTGLAQRVGYFGRNRLVNLTVIFAVLVFAAAIGWMALPAGDSLDLARDVAVSLAAMLVVVVAVYAIVHAVSALRRRPPSRPEAVAPQAELAMFNWRREETVFLGSRKPVEDSSWVFQLRMAELERAQSRRTSEPRPWRRLAARVFDYGIWGATLVAALHALDAYTWVQPELAAWLANPFIAPILITGSWIPIEALLGASLNTTPGKWLFSVYLQFAISDAYAERSEGANFGRWLRRSIRVWMRGVGCGIPLVALFAMALAGERLRREQETSWDYDGDCLVTQGSLSGLSVAAGIAGLASATWLFSAIWSGPVVDSVAELRRFAVRGSALIRDEPDRMVRGLGDTAVAWGRRLAGMAGLSFPGSGRGSSPGTLTPAESAARVDDRRGPAGAESAAEPRSPATSEPSAAVVEVATARVEELVVRPAAASPAQAGRTAPPVWAAAAPAAPMSAAVDKRQRTLASVRAEGRRAISDGDYSRALRPCEAWTALEPSSIDAWRCYGGALDGDGRHREAVSAYRRASALAPEDARLKAAISRSEEAMFTQFRERYRADR
jgi:hypothetical protein